MDDGYTMVQSVTNALSETAGDYLGDITEIWVDSKLPDNISRKFQSSRRWHLETQ